MATPNRGKKREAPNTFLDLLKSVHSDMSAVRTGVFFNELRDGASEGKPFEDRGRHRRFPTDKYWELKSTLEQCHRELARKEAEIRVLKTGIHPKNTPDTFRGVIIRNACGTIRNMVGVLG